MFFGNNAALYDYIGPVITWANELNVGMNHAPGAALIARPVGLQSSMLPSATATPTNLLIKYDNISFLFLPIHCNVKPS